VLDEDDTRASSIAAALLARGARLAVAETTAGGLISARLVSVAGASAWFDRGVVCYSARAKLEATGVAPETLKEHGAVSVAAVSAMATGLRALAGVDFALAESGIAGPLASRRSPKPVGSVAIAVAGPRGVVVVETVLPGSRAEVMERVAERSLEVLLRAITGA
jgi:PncC family amidohydrolase